MSGQYISLAYEIELSNLMPSGIQLVNYTDNLIVDPQPGEISSSYSSALVFS